MEYECPCCGAKAEFDSDLQKLKCPYCDTTFDVAAMKDHDRELESENQTPPEDLSWQREKQRWLDEEKSGLKVYTCQSCGGEIFADETTAATHCPYCGNPVIMTGNLADDLKPDGVIPFQVNKAMAMNALKTHMSGKKLLARHFASDNILSEVKGVYIPFWLFDADASGEVRYHATQVRTWKTAQHICTETSHYSVTRGGSLGFRRIPVDGGSKVPDELMESVEPFDFSRVVPFQTAYLSGYFADRYDVESEESQKRADQRARATILDRFAQTVTGYDKVEVERSNIQLKNPKAQYVLCPMWLLTVNYQGKDYLFAVNGQTGKIAGNMPVDEKAASDHRLGYTLAIGGVMALISLFFFGPNLLTIAGCFLIGYFVSGGMVDDLKKEVAGVEKQRGASGYADSAGLNLTTRLDRFLYSNVSRVPIPQNTPHGGMGPGGVRPMRKNPPPMGGMNQSPMGGSPRSGGRPPVGGSSRPGGPGSGFGGSGGGSRPSGGFGSGGMNRPGSGFGSSGGSRPRGGMGRPSGMSRPGGSRPGGGGGPRGGMGRSGGGPRGGGSGRR